MIRQPLEALFADKPGPQPSRPLKTYGVGHPDLPDPFDVKPGVQAYFIEGNVRNVVEAQEDTWKTVAVEPLDKPSEDRMQPEASRPGPQAELKRKAAAYDRLVARLAPDESLHPDLRKFVPFIHAVLEGECS